MPILPLLLAVAQLTDQPSTDKLPPANPVPIEAQGGERAVLDVLQRLLGARDSASVTALTMAEGGVTVLTESSGDPLVVRLPWAAFKSSGEERLLDPAIEIEGDLATLWSPYVDYTGTRIAGCGVDQATLVRAGGTWRVLTLARSIKRSGCDPIRR